MIYWFRHLLNVMNLNQATSQAINRKMSGCVTSDSIVQWTLCSQCVGIPDEDLSFERQVVNLGVKGNTTFYDPSNDNGHPSLGIHGLPVTKRGTFSHCETGTEFNSCVIDLGNPTLWKLNVTVSDQSRAIGITFLSMNGQYGASLKQNGIDFGQLRHVYMVHEPCDVRGKYMIDAIIRSYGQSIRKKQYSTSSFCIISSILDPT